MAAENGISSMGDLNTVGVAEGGSNAVADAASIAMARFKLEAKSESSKNNVMHTRNNLSVTPIVVDFNRLMQQERARLNSNKCNILPVVSGISNKDLLHAVVGLYDTCLAELTPDVIYSTVCSKWAKTIVLVRDVKDVFLEFEQRRDEHNLCKEPKYKHVDISKLKVHKTEGDKYEPPDAPPSTFACCYSDTESEEEEDSDDEEEDHSQGINKYLDEAAARRQVRLSHMGPFNLEHVGAENRVIAACTFDKKYIKTGEKITHLTLLSIRKRFRRLGLGKYLLQEVKDPIVSGPHEAVVVHAESEAAPFFSRYGFSDDLILNSRWKEISEQFTNCLLLTYIPPYSGQAVANNVTDIDLLALEKDLRKWKDKSIESYQSQVTIIERMKSEMMRLRSMVSAQNNIIKDLQAKVDQLETDKLRTENQLMAHKIELLARQNEQESELPKDTSFSSSDTLLSRYQILSNLQVDTDGETIQALPSSTPSTMVASTEQELKRYMVVSQNAVEVYDHGKDIAEFHRICEDFKNSMRKDMRSRCAYTVTSVSKALLSQSVVDRYARILKEVGDDSSMMKLYYCGSLSHPERLKDILKNGFSEQDMTDGEYGRGLYFSKLASTAVHFSTPNKVLVAEVIVGKSQTVTSKDRCRCSPGTGFNSVLCPGRLASGKGDYSSLQEYIIHDINQALPLDLIEFTAAESASSSTN